MIIISSELNFSNLCQIFPKFCYKFSVFSKFMYNFLKFHNHIVFHLKFWRVFFLQSQQTDLKISLKFPDTKFLTYLKCIQKNFTGFFWNFPQIRNFLQIFKQFFENASYFQYFSKVSRKSYRSIQQLFNFFFKYSDFPWSLIFGRNFV